MKQWILLIITLAANVWGWAQPNPAVFKLESSDFDTNHVKFLIDKSVEVELDSASLMLEQAVYISDRLDYKSGLYAGFGKLIDTYHDNGKIVEELRSRIRYGLYLKDEASAPELTRNQISISDIFLGKGMFDKATESLNRSIGLAEKYAPGDLYQLYKKKGWAHQQISEFDSAGIFYRKALKIAEEKDNTKDLLWIKQQYAKIYHQRMSFESEVRVNREILEITRKENLKSEEMIALNNLAFSYKYLGQPDSAIRFFTMVETAASQSDEPIMRAQALQSRGIVYQNKGNMTRAVADMEKASSLFKNAGLTQAYANILDFEALALFQSGKSYEAEEVVKEAIKVAKKYDHPAELGEAYRTMALIQEENYEFEEALKYFELHLNIRDSLNRSASSGRERLYNQQFLIEQTEKQLELQNIGEEIAQLEIAKANAEAEEQASRAKVAEREKELASLEAKKAEADLIALRRQSQLESQKREIDALAAARNLAEQQRIADSLSNLREIERRETEKKDLEQKNQIQELRIKEEQARLETEKARGRNLMYILIGLAVFLLFVVFLTARLRRQNNKINQQNVTITENQKVIEAEKEKSDNLLLNILPPTVAAELKEKGTAAPRSYDAVSVIFTDFKGFTTIAEKLSPEDLIKTLDQIFLEFDLICEKHGLSRIKTIGDAYMAAAGLPDPDNHHAVKAVRAAIEMRDFVLKFNEGLSPDEPQWGIRIGVNSGPVVAGVVGIRKFAYDIWGDAVNVASRMESAGEAGKVNISEATFDIVKDKFACEYRGKLEAKNKGKVGMYFVENAG